MSFVASFTAEAQKFAKKQLLETESRMILLQETRNNLTWTDVEFLKTSNEQLVECRRVLKFTYAFGYYLTMPPKGEEKDEKELTKKEAKEAAKKSAKAEVGGEEAEVEEPPKEQTKQKERFEFHQSMLERFTEALSELVEKPLVDIDRAQVVNRTRGIDQFMKNMLQYVEDGMEE